MAAHKGTLGFSCGGGAGYGGSYSIRASAVYAVSATCCTAGGQTSRRASRDSLLVKNAVLGKALFCYSVFICFAPFRWCLRFGTNMDLKQEEGELLSLGCLPLLAQRFPPDDPYVVFLFSAIRLFAVR